MYKRNILVSRVNDDVNLNVIIFFLSDSTTRPSDLPLYVIVESGNSRSVSLKSCFKWPRPFWGDLEQNENRPRPLPLTPMLNPFFFTKQSSLSLHDGSPLADSSPSLCACSDTNDLRHKVQHQHQHIWLVLTHNVGLFNVIFNYVVNGLNVNIWGLSSRIMWENR